MDESLPEVYLARHGETAWSLEGRHTGRTDIPLTKRGERKRGCCGDGSRGSPSPRSWSARSRGRGGLASWRASRPSPRSFPTSSSGTMAIMKAGSPPTSALSGQAGISSGTVARAVSHSRRWVRRADRVITRLRSDGGRVLLFGHGHFFRILGARWTGLTTEDARHLVLSTASLSIVGYEHSMDDSAILLWNDDHHVNQGA